MNPEFGRRVAFTLGALLVFRIGTYIPLPGINFAVWDQIWHSHGGGVLGTANMLSGGAVARLSVFALGITPYVSAALIMQLVSFFAPGLRRLRVSGESGRRAIDLYTAILALLLAAFQSYGVATGLEAVTNLVAEPGTGFRFTVILTLTGGSMVLIWLAMQITARGFGNGIALILCTGIVVAIPLQILGALAMRQRGLFSEGVIAGLVLLAVALVAIVTLVEKARRYEPVEFTPRDGARRASLLSFKLNGAGLVPSILAAWLLMILLALVSLLGLVLPGPWHALQGALTQGHLTHIVCYALLILFFAYLYTALVLDPGEAAERLMKLGGVIPRVEPGEPTADHLDRVLSGTTLIGAIYFVAICLIPELLIYGVDLPFYLGGTSLLIVTCTVLDLEQQARAYVGAPK